MSSENYLVIFLSMNINQRVSARYPKNKVNQLSKYWILPLTTNNKFNQIFPFYKKTTTNDKKTIIIMFKLKLLIPVICCDLKVNSDHCVHVYSCTLSACSL